MSKAKLFILAVAVLTFSLAQAQVDTLTLMHVNDTHSHLLPYGPKDSDGNWTWGGMARMATLIGMTRMTEPNVMLFHSGDLFVGDFMFQEYVGVAELEIMKALGYTALELGNHEFDLYPSTLKYVLNQAGFPAQGFPVLCANLDMTADPELDYFVQPYIIQEISGVRVGVFGLMTELTNQISNPSPVVVLPPLAQAQAWVDTLRIGHDCDLVILLSHMGIFEEQLAAATIGGIDIILGGHTHTVTPAPIVIGNTVLVQAGEFAKHIGKLTVITNAGAVQDWSYQLLNIDSSVPAEPTLAGMIDFLAAGVEADPRFGPVYSAVIAHASRDITKPFGEGLCRDNPLGNLVADAMRSATATQIAIQPQGFISQTIYAGPVKGADIFQAVPYGFDQATGLGLKLVTFETNGMSLIYGLEFATYNLPYVEDFFLHGSNISYAYNSANTPGARVDYGSIRINGLPLDPTATYTVTVPDAVVPFFSQIPGFQVNNLVATGLSLYTVVRDFMAGHSPVTYYAEGRVIDFSMLENPVAGIGGMIDVVWQFEDNGSIYDRHTANLLQKRLEIIKASIERGQGRAALNQLNAFELKLQDLADSGLISQTASERLIILAEKLAESIDSDYAHPEMPQGSSPLPYDAKLNQNYPNPFNGSTVISFTLPGATNLNLAIYDLAGRKVRTLLAGYQEAGHTSVTWDGKDENGRNVSSGIYFYNLKAGDISMTRKMNYLK
ncbi:MAG: hypothetical protein A2W25_09995 [candidate division Zixibacteria bacterium RBG_16_53_22]|nr:MAG: hypothetical protein A2W25_09995 [candidate division Zixibacteria bacterium RBG_16_53_22]